MLSSQCSNITIDNQKQANKEVNTNNMNKYINDYDSDYETVECITPNIYLLLDYAIKNEENCLYKKLVLYLINISTTQKSKLVTLNNHYKNMIDSKAVNIRNDINKVAIACFNESTKIESDVYMGVNIYTCRPQTKSIPLSVTLLNKQFEKNLAEKKMTVENISNKPANPSIELNAFSSECKLKKFIIDTTTKEFNIQEQNNIIDLKNKSDEKLEVAQLAKKFNILTYELNKIANQPKQPSRFIELLIAHSPYLANNINSILVKLEELVLYADAHSNELNEKLRILPNAQYQLLARFIRACAYKQAKIPRNKQEEDVLLKTEEKEFDLFRTKYRNPAYPGANVRTIFKLSTESFLNSIPLDIDKLFEVYGMYI